MIRTGPQTRRGYTLVELLVVMALMILLAALAAGVSYSGMIGSQKVISGADTASGWLLIAKQTALRDRAPRGVRFFLNAATAPATGFVVTEAQYIEQPDIWIPNPAQEGNPGGARIAFVYQYNAANVITSTDVYLISGNAADLTAYDSRIQAGDALILPEFGMSFKIVNPNVTFTAPLALGPALGAVGTAIPIPVANCRKLTLVSVPDLASAGTPIQGSPPPVGTPITMQTYKFAFQSQPQVLLGQPVLQLPAGVVIDYRDPGAGGYRTWDFPPPATASPNAGPYNPPTTIGVTHVPVTVDPTGPYFDILFAPSGQVLKNANSLICLWVRDPEAVPHPRLDSSGNCDSRTVFNDAGEQALIVVSVKSGLINTQPVNPPPPAPVLNYDPYLFARDGLSSGL